MTSIVYNSFWDDMARNLINAGSDSFKCMLTNATYDAIADETKKDTHLKRSAVTANEITGTGYTAAGTAATVTVTKDTANNRVDISLGAVSWASATITARGAVYYKARGGADTADELVAYIDFAALITSTNGTFSLSASTVRVQN